MHATLRPWGPDDEPFLWEMLYRAIHVPPGHAPPPRSILDEHKIAHHLTEFGAREGDDAVIACDGGAQVGAAFCRRFSEADPSYGFVSADVPEVGIAVVTGFQGKGIGRSMLDYLLERYPTMSLSVDSDNHRARTLYESLGFVEAHLDGTSVTMIRRP